MEFLCEGRDRIHGVPGLFAQMICCECGTAFVWPAPDAATLALHYPESYEAYAASRRPGFLRRVTDTLGARTKARHVKRFVSGGRLLDVGCGGGVFLEEMARGRFSARGLESSAYGVAACRRRGLEVERGDFESIAFAGESFEAITMWHVLEHLRDPAAAVKKVSETLRPGGWFIFCVPNADSLNAKIFGRLWAGYDVPRHLFAFSRLGLERMLESAGMKIEDRRTFFGSFSALRYDLKFWLEEKFGTRMSESSDRSDSSDLSEKPARGSDVRRTAERGLTPEPREETCEGDCPHLRSAGEGVRRRGGAERRKGSDPCAPTVFVGAAQLVEWGLSPKPVERPVPEATATQCSARSPRALSRALHFALVGPHARPLWAPVMSLVEKFGLGPVVTYAARKPRTVAVRRGV